MISAKAVTYKDRRTFTLARIRPEEGAVALQLFGSDPSVVAEAAAIISGGYGAIPRRGSDEEDLSVWCAPVAIDINMGCPVNKIFSNGEGIALMGNPSLIRDIVGAASRAISIPLTVKLRAGIDGEHINAVECALAAQEGGAAMVCIHGRTRRQMYSGLADRGVIADVKAALKIPVIANGDIRRAEDALSMLRDTAADGVAVGRGAVGNPFLFREIVASFGGGTYEAPTVEERAGAALYQLRLAVADKGERVAVNEARKQIGEYFRGLRGSAALRGAVNLATCYGEIERAVVKMIKEDEECPLQ
jgi:nifR3 family TIM-barrel protein